jgi:repressor LexA
MLTRKQYALLQFLAERIQKEGVSPSFDEMKDALDLRSKSGIHRLITALEERGFIRRLPHRARAIEILKMPETMHDALTEKPRPQPSGFSPRVVEGGLGRADGPLFARREDSAPAYSSSNDGVMEVPLVGKIAAGTPIDALEHVQRHVGVPADMLGSGEHFALSVEGDSMVDAGIHDGDLVVIRRQDTANDGEIVVALVADQEATLKRLRRRGPQVELQAANPMHKDQIYPADQVRVQGRLVGLVRTY